jgi:5-methylcytosine-specific restriction endonuclease McrA
MTDASRNMPSKAKIKRFWASRLSNRIWRKADSTDEVIAVDFCFACGVSGLPLERCHIHARSMGGDDLPRNLHLLCRWCHLESELLSGLEYFRWFKKRSFAEGLRTQANNFLKYAAKNNPIIVDAIKKLSE